MGELLTGLLRLAVQAVLLVAGLVVAASFVAAGLLLAAVFGLRLLWARLTGRPLTVRVAGMDPAAGWRRYRDWQARATRPQPRTGRPGVRLPAQDVEDVQAKEPGAPR